MGTERPVVFFWSQPGCRHGCMACQNRRRHTFGIGQETEESRLANCVPACPFRPGCRQGEMCHTPRGNWTGRAPVAGGCSGTSKGGLIHVTIALQETTVRSAQGRKFLMPSLPQSTCAPRSVWWISGVAVRGVMAMGIPSGKSGGGEGLVGPGWHFHGSRLRRSTTQLPS